MCVCVSCAGVVCVSVRYLCGFGVCGFVHGGATAIS